MAVKVNDLLNYGLTIYQDDNYFKFSIDSVLLAEFVKVKCSDKNVLDLCCGNTPLLMILAQKYDMSFYGMELQKEIFNLAKESVEANKLNIELINDNIKNSEKYFRNDYFDIITCNPPYFKISELSKVNVNDVKAKARHEIEITLEDVIKISFRLLKKSGYLYLVHRSDRIMEIVHLLEQYSFSIKRIRFAYDSKNKDCCCVLFECVKEGKTTTKIEKPLYIDEFMKEKSI